MLASLPLKNIQITDPFFKKRIDQAIDISIPYMWKALNDQIPGIPESHCIKNFKIAAGKMKGEFRGRVFQDSDLYKWIECVAFSLEIRPDPELEKLVDKCVDLVGQVQLEDGYLDTYYIIGGLENRWTNIRRTHEMYVAGHMFEAAAAYYHATGKTKFLDIACRLADHIDTVFGPKKGQKKGYPGHQEIEIGLVKLYQITGNKKYLKLAKFFLDQRGKKPYYYDIETKLRGNDGGRPEFDIHGPSRYSYQQAHLPVRQQTTAVGHAVRAGYMYTAMADVGALSKDETLIDAAKVLWDDIVNKQMYVVGGVGSMIEGEAYSFDYDMPNDSMYLETCANISLMMFALRMQKIKANAEYADVMELALYNSVLSGIQLDGQKFFYVNPMEVWPQRSLNRENQKKVQPVRQGWFGCACCPTNVVRTLTGLNQYIYTQDADTLYVNLFIGSRAETKLAKKNVTLVQEGNYPWSGELTYKFEMDGEAEFALAIRIPEWAKGAVLTLNGEKVDLAEAVKDGYAVIRKAFTADDVIKLELPMAVRVLRCSSRVPYNVGKVAVKRGPIVYCAEEVDNGNELWSLYLDSEAPITEKFEKKLLEGVVTLKASGVRSEVVGDELYSENKIKSRKASIKLVPYYAWCNREPGEMIVWMHEK